MHEKISRLSIAPALSDASGRIENEFAKWFKEYVHNPINGVTNPFLQQLSLGPISRLKTWPEYFVSGYKFHTQAWGSGKQTINSGVWVKESYEDKGGEDDYYGLLDEVIELEYPGLPIMRVVLFKFQWFDPTPKPNQSTRTGDQDCMIVEVRRNGKYRGYDPFIITQLARQVYYVSYPGRIRDKVQWLVVIKTKAKGIVDVEESLEVAYQSEEGAIVNRMISDDLIEPLNDHDDIVGDIVDEELIMCDEEEGNDANDDSVPEEDDEYDNDANSLEEDEYDENSS